ncbi:MAG: CpaE family protein [Caulobacteraceae bacterium]
MMRTAKADFGQTGFDDDFGGFDVDDDFAMPSTPSEASGVMTWEEPGAALSAPRTEPAPADPSALGPGLMEGALLVGGDALLGETAVPRISIHIFCQRNETAALAEQMKADRRLARASTTIRPGGLDDALTVYQNQPTPSLIMLESTADAATLLAGLDRLAEVCDPGTKVVVIGTHNDIPLYRELMRRGVSEYLVPPLQTLQLIRVVTTLYSDPTTPFIGRTLAFVGAKGGVGASTVAHNVAYAMSEQTHASTVIVDYDLPFGTAGLDFNQDPLQGFADALSKPDRLDPVLLDRMTARCGDRLSLFAAPASLDEDHEYSADTYEEVLGKIRATAPYVVLDLPHLWTGWMRRTLLSADDVVVVAAPDLASLRNAKNLLDLVRKGRPNDQPPQLVLNQVGVPGRPEIPVKDFSKALGLEPALVLPFDAKLFGQAANNGQMILEINGKSKVSEGLAQFAQQLSRREPVAAAPKTAKSLIERLRSRG